MTKKQMDSLERLHNDLLYWNDQVNMISRKDIAHLWERHIVHSLMLLKYVDFKQKARVLDIGTGGGLPGIPIKIARPDLRVVLIDSISKKVKMARMFAEHTGQKNITVESGRVEDLAEKAHYAGSFDVITSRAVARIERLITWSRPLLAKDGVYALLKGGDLDEEIAEAREAFPDVKIEEISIKAFGMPGFTKDEKKVITCRFS